MVRLLFADLYQQEGLDDSILRTKQLSTSTVSKPSKSQITAPRARSDEQSVWESKAVEGLLPANPPSFVSNRHHRRGFTERLSGLSHFLRYPLRKSAGGGGGGSSLPSYAHHQARSSGAPGPEDLPRSINAVCMLYCFTIGSLKEIRNDILAG